MAAEVASLIDKGPGFDTFRLDVSCLVGYQVKIYSEQFPGRELTTKVVSAQDREITVDSGGNFSLIDNLVSQQKVILQFPYKGQDLAVRAKLRRSQGGRCNLIVDKRVVPITQRKHHRVNWSLTVKLAPFPVAAHSRRTLSSLRWISTDSVNVSSGGMMVNLPSFLHKDVYLLVHVDWEEAYFPPLVMGRVCHCFQADDGRFAAGIEFIIQEIGEGLFPAARFRELPAAVFRYTSRCREKLNRKLLLWNPKERDYHRSS